MDAVGGRYFTNSMTLLTPAPVDDFHMQDRMRFLDRKGGLFGGFICFERLLGLSIDLETELMLLPPGLTYWFALSLCPGRACVI